MSAVIIPIPGPNSTIVLRELKSIVATMAADKTLELGSNAPTARGDLQNSEKNVNRSNDTHPR